MPVQGTIRTPVCSATRAMKWTSRPPNIAVGSTIVRTPQSLAALTASSAAASSASGSYRLGQLAATASSRKRTCSWIRTVPSSPASTGPCTVCTCAIVVLPVGSGPSRNVPPEIGGRRSPPGGVLDPRNTRGIPSDLRPCLAAPATGLSSATSREDPLRPRAPQQPGDQPPDGHVDHEREAPVHGDGELAVVEREDPAERPDEPARRVVDGLDQFVAGVGLEDHEQDPERDDQRDDRHHDVHDAGEHAERAVHRDAATTARGDARGSSACHRLPPTPPRSPP